LFLLPYDFITRTQALVGLLSGAPRAPVEWGLAMNQRVFRRAIAPALLVLIAFFASACASGGRGADRFEGPAGTVIGSVVVELERTRRSAWDGFFEDDLAVRDPAYLLRFANRDPAWNRVPAEVRVEGKSAVPFVITLPSGRGGVESLEIVLYEGPFAWPLGLVSATDGKEVPVDLVFDVDPGRVTYIGRIHIVLPRKLQLFSSHVRVRVEDAYETDRVSLRTLLENTPLPVARSLAHRDTAK